MEGSPSTSAAVSTGNRRRGSMLAIMERDSRDARITFWPARTSSSARVASSARALPRRSRYRKETNAFSIELPQCQTRPASIDPGFGSVPYRNARIGALRGPDVEVRDRRDMAVRAIARGVASGRSMVAALTASSTRLTSAATLRCHAVRAHPVATGAAEVAACCSYDRMPRIRPTELADRFIVTPRETHKSTAGHEPITTQCANRALSMHRSDRDELIEKSLLRSTTSSP